MLKKSFIVCTILISLNCCEAQKIKSSLSPSISVDWIKKNLKDASNNYQFLMHHVPDGVMPVSFANDSLKTCKSGDWVAGFYPGTLIYLFEGTKDAVLYKEALRKITLMDKEQYNTSTHDLGFMMYCSYGNLNRLTPSDVYKKILMNSARSLASRFNPKVGCIRSWGNSNDSAEFRVIIDNMMNLELLFWATRESKDSSFYKIAITHANTTLKNHFRKDYSSYHVVVYDPQTGKVIKKQTAQGAADASAWARGQSWGLYGYTMMYRETKDKKYLNEAQHIASFILNNPNLPADKIPYWDYDAPGIPNTYRDASSAAIMASALIELAGYSDKTLSKKYLDNAGVILKSLSSPEYKATTKEAGGFLLKHSVGNLNAHADVDVPLPYADYYYVEALLRYRNKLK
ncbi:MAG: glycoside hydrolase family 88 protein [Bacteroidota bacterium]|nr:glycoside hydrolase family 88 protein [Bacteroidota bacterium]